MKKKFIPAYLLNFVNILGISILIPVLPFIIEEYGAPKWVYGLLLTLYSSFQFIGAPYLGTLSDNIGRKPVLLISQSGTLVSWFIFLGALFIPDEFTIYGITVSLFVLALSRILDGITGGNISATNAYVSDITNKVEKSYIFGYLGGITGIGMIIGPGLGGLTATTFGNSGTIITAIIISTFTLLAIYFWLKESHPAEKRNAQKDVSIFQTFLFRKKLKNLDAKPIIKQLFGMKLFFSTMVAWYFSTIPLFLKDTFHFDQQELGFFMFIIGIFLAFNQVVVAKQFVKRIGEIKTLVTGVSLCFVGLICLTLTKNLYIFILYYYIMNLGASLTFPMFSSLIALNSDPKKQGEVMGISESIGSITMAVFPVIATFVYSKIGSNMYFLMTLFPASALLIAYFSFRNNKATS